MKAFKEFYYKLLSESPMNIGDADDFYNMETKEAMAKFSEILDDPSRYKKVFTFNTNPELFLYEEYDGGDVVCWALPSNNNFVYAYVAYEQRLDGGIITTSVFNDPKFPQVAYKIYMDYLLKRYKYIMSDKRHTPRGRGFWVKIISNNIMDNTKELSIYDLTDDRQILIITHFSDIDRFYGNNEDFERYRIKIENI